MTIDVVDTSDWRRSATATGVLRTFNEAGVIDSSDVVVAQRLTALAKDTDERVALAVAFVVRAVRAGSVCVALADVEQHTAIADESTDRGPDRASSRRWIALPGPVLD